MKIKILATLVMVIGFLYLLPEPNKALREASVTDVERSLNHHFMIRNVRFYDGDNLYSKIDVLVENQTIADIGEKLVNSRNYPELDATGKTLLPGLVDAHTHTWGEALTQAINYGVTTELDMFTMPEASQPYQSIRDDLSNVHAADLFSATILATAPKGHGTEYGFEIPVLESVSQVKEFVEDRINDGADYIKAVYLAQESKRLIYPSISKEILAELIEVSHRNKKMLVVHVDNLVSATHAIEMGADGIIHSFMDEVVDQSFIDLMVSQKAFIIPTLSVEASVAGLAPGRILTEEKLINRFLSIEQNQQLNASFDDFGIPKTAFKIAQRSVALLSRAGVPILAGSDAPNPGTAHGVSIHGELALLVESGLTPEQAIHSATGAARKFFPIGLRGSLVKGAKASMILIDGDPFNNIKNTQNIRYIWKNGVQFKRKLAQDDVRSEKPLVAALITDFNQRQNDTRIGAGVSATSDQYIGGNSSVSLDYIDKESSPLDAALRVKGEIRAGAPYLWSGLAYLPGNSLTQGANLTAIKTLLFEAKGGDNFNELTIMIFQQGSRTPTSQRIQLSTHWQSYQIEFSGLSNLDYRRISNISFVATGRMGMFEFSLDNLEFQ